MAKAGRQGDPAQLAGFLVQYGIQENCASLVAGGIVRALQVWCWANMTDVLGTADTVDQICNSPLPKLSMARLLVKCRILQISKGRYYMPSAYLDRPVNVDKKWRRLSYESYRQAKSRADERPTLFDVTDMVDSKFTEVSILGDARKVKSDAKAKGTPGHVEIRTYWWEQWAVHVGSGSKYPFSGVDGACIKQLIQRTEDIVEAKAVIDAYLVCHDRFYAGKPLKKLIADLPRFIASCAEGNGRAGTIEDPAGDIPDLTP